MDCYNTLGLLRELGQAEIDLLFLIKGKAGFASKSKYCKSYKETSNIQEGFEYLKNNYIDEAFKPIIITSGDDIVTYLDIHRDELCDRYILPVTKEKGNTKKYSDKLTMTSLAQSLGILCPESRSIKWNSCIGGIHYPCIIKPSHQKIGHYNEFKIKICKTEKDLRHILRYVHHDSEFIVQQFIPKTVDYLVYGCRFRDGKTTIAGVLVRDRMNDSGASSHGLITDEVPSSVDTAKITKFLETIEYFGPFSFEYGAYEDRAYFFEVNLRNDGTSHYFYQAGANLPLAYVYSCAGLDYSEIPICVGEKRWFIDELFDVENVITRNISKEKWKQEMNKATIYKYYDEEDIEPYSTVKKEKNKQIIRDIVLNKLRVYIVSILDKIEKK